MSDALVSEDKMEDVDSSDEYEVVEDELDEDPEEEAAPRVEAESDLVDDDYVDADDEFDGDVDSEGQLDEPEEDDSEEGDGWADDAPAVDEAVADVSEVSTTEGDPVAQVEGEGEAEDDDSRGPGPGANLSDEQITERIYALLFASPEPLSVGKLVTLLERPQAARVRSALESIGRQLDSGPLPYQLRGIKGGYTLMTVPEMGEVVGRLAKGAAVERISPAALETLAIVAYRQPVTKAEIEAIRGVQAGPILRSLVDRSLVRVTGRADVPGHPLQYGTTKDFLDRFGLMGLGDLPRDAELAKD
ncbi:hypothetical protein Poly30_19820 [Planctomycetes bacterium Poly30]|uniref:Segregation and condensation protein B n=1 Tax=Saltatorellus ferox TaxID=2528018 RepID=A0A518EQV2_9BACT|nr:hypothetical protein Poly30_19820 [Planctomycetes bacterium Poly30]